MNKIGDGPPASDDVHMLWIGGPLTTMERLSMASFVQNGHRVILHVYDQVKGVPEGVHISDADEILPRGNVFANGGTGLGSAGYAGFSDWFRYELLSKRQGYWCDTDVVCLKPFRFDRYPVVATSREGQWGEPALGCVLRLESGNPLLSFCLDFCRENDISSLVKKNYIAAGPSLLQEGIRRFGLNSYQEHPDIFCPISWRHSAFISRAPMDRVIYNIKRRLRGGETVEVPKPSSFAVHLWQSTWKLANIDPDARHSRFSLYGRLKKRYRIA